MALRHASPPPPKASADQSLKADPPRQEIGGERVPRREDSCSAPRGRIPFEKPSLAGRSWVDGRAHARAQTVMDEDKCALQAGRSLIRRRTPTGQGKGAGGSGGRESLVKRGRGAGGKESSKGEEGGKGMKRYGCLEGKEDSRGRTGGKMHCSRGVRE